MGYSPGQFAGRRGLLGLGAALIASQAAHAERRHALPRLAAYAGSGCPAAEKVTAYEQWLGRSADLVMDFLDPTSWDGMAKMASWATWCWGRERRQLVLTVPMLVNREAPTLEQGAAGAFDDYFRALADIIVAKGHPGAILRIGHEFNGGWYRWTARRNPEAFSAYWRRIALAMRSASGAAFRFDWNLAIVEGPSEQAYPGDDVVDIIGLDVYNQSWPLIADPDQRWGRLMGHPTGLRWHRDFAAAHRKPRSFPEWGTGTRPDGHGAGDDPAFVRRMLEWMQEGEAVDYHCYWNYRAPDFDAKVTDGRLPLAAEALRTGLR